MRFCFPEDISAPLWNGQKSRDQSHTHPHTQIHGKLSNDPGFSVRVQIHTFTHINSPRNHLNFNLSATGNALVNVQGVIHMTVI